MRQDHACMMQDHACNQFAFFFEAFFLVRSRNEAMSQVIASSECISSIVVLGLLLARCATQ